jgi:hypothetical protein
LNDQKDQSEDRHAIGEACQCKVHGVKSTYCESGGIVDCPIDWESKRPC